MQNLAKIAAEAAADAPGVIFIKLSCEILYCLVELN